MHLRSITNPVTQAKDEAFTCVAVVLEVSKPATALAAAHATTMLVVLNKSRGMVGGVFYIFATIMIRE